MMSIMYSMFKFAHMYCPSEVSGMQSGVYSCVGYKRPNYNLYKIEYNWGLMFVNS